MLDDLGEKGNKVYSIGKPHFNLNIIISYNEKEYNCVSTSESWQKWSLFLQ